MSTLSSLSRANHIKLKPSFSSYRLNVTNRKRLLCSVGYYLRACEESSFCPGSYVTQTLLDEKSEEAVSAAFIPVWESYEWNFDKDYSATFNAVEGHKYQIQFGVYVGVKGATIAGSFDGYVDFDSSNRYIVVQYIHLSW